MKTLKDIEARLAQIKNELNTRGAELTEAEIAAFETEVGDLQEQRQALLDGAEKRKKLLEKIANGEPVDDGDGGETTPTVLRNFKALPGKRTAINTRAWSTERHLCSMCAVAQKSPQSTGQTR